MERLGRAARAAQGTRGRPRAPATRRRPRGLPQAPAGGRSPRAARSQVSAAPLGQIVIAGSRPAATVEPARVQGAAGGTVRSRGHRRRGALAAGARERLPRRRRARRAARPGRRRASASRSSATSARASRPRAAAPGPGRGSARRRVALDYRTDALIALVGSAAASTRATCRPPGDRRLRCSASRRRRARRTRVRAAQRRRTRDRRLGRSARRGAERPPRPSRRPASASAPPRLLERFSDPGGSTLRPPRRRSCGCAPRA